MKSGKLLVIMILLLAGILSAQLNDKAIESIFSDTFLSGEDVYEQLNTFNNYPQAEVKQEVIARKLEDDTPWYYYVPGSYNEEQAAGLIVWLHGGVGRQDYIDDHDYIYKNWLIESCEQQGMLLLLPMARYDNMWWIEKGEGDILAELKEIKENYNIDDNRVYMTGFSDGGSGSFHFSAKLIDNFASFYPLNGMISVAAGETGSPIYPGNMRNRYVRAVNTDKDGLYPAAKTRKTMKLAQEAGAFLSYREYWGIGHDWGYFAEDLPLLLMAMDLHPRNPFHDKIYWECYDGSRYNKCDWLQIEVIDTLQTKKSWHQEYNVKLTSDRISFGFYHDSDFKGDGVLVQKVIDNTVAAEMGLKKEDIIIAMDGITLTTIEELSAAKAEKKRGDEVSLTVYRETATEELTGRFPEAEEYDAFIYNKPSGAVTGNYYGNIFSLETSRVRELTVYISPQMVNMELPVTIMVNGEQLYHGKVQYDKEVMQKSIMRDLDRKSLWVDKIKIAIPEL